ncbi:helix-turn-helix transcriptional regulator [Spirillospora sp. NPDC029432]|uniref:helix-turn-helix domain-containing protein n=1 Tax=Spirillospora sp. NPDC029432 TaxID=3154599 RepID=UPI003452F7F5
MTTTSSAPNGGRATLVQGDPLVPRMLLGKRLRDLREEAGLTRLEAAEGIGSHDSKVIRLEAGRSGVRREDVIALLTLYGLPDQGEWATLLALADETGARPWWYDLRDVVARYERRYFSAEEAAKLVRCFDDQYVPELLQTEAYARELLANGLAAASGRAADRRIELLARRQRLLRRRPRPVNLWAVVHEAALWRAVGNAEVMRAQLEHIKKIAERPNVTVQIAPYDARRAATGPLTLVRFPQAHLPDIVYLEGLGTARYPSRPKEIESHWHVFNTLVTEADPPERTRHIIDGVLATC